MAWNGSSGSSGHRSPSTAKSSRHLPWRGALVLAVLVALGCVLLLFFIRDNKISSVSSNVEELDKSGANVKTPIAKTPLKSESPDPSPKRKVYSSPPKSVEEAIARIDEGHEPLKTTLVKIPEAYKHRTFSTGFEQLISWVFHTEPGDMPMPIPPLTDQDRENMASILLSKNEILEGDDEETANAKKVVDIVKQDMVKYVKEGGDPEDFLSFYYGELRKAFEKRNEAERMFEEMKEEDGPEMANEFARKINKAFATEGIKPIYIKADDDAASQPEEGDAI